jgi:DinB superfamily
VDRVVSPIDPSTLLGEARRELTQLPEILNALLENLDEATARARPLPEEWAPVEIVCHLRDEETEDFAARLRVVLEGRTAFTPIDPVGWVEQRGYQKADLRDALVSFRERRAASLVWLGDIVPAHLGRSVAHPAIGQLSGLDLLAAWVTHDRLHLAQLAGTLARLWSSRFVPLKAEYAGPIPYAPAPVS